MHARCRATNLRAVLVLVLAALSQWPAGDAAAGSDQPPLCIEVSTAGAMEPAVELADVIVIGEVVERAEAGSVTVRPEAYFKGPAEAADIVLLRPDGDLRCGLAELSDGDRMILFLVSRSGTLAWPGEKAALVIGGTSASDEESELVGEIRGVTGQFAIPADGEGGASLDFGSAVLPVGAGLLVLFAIGLVLMRIWHRIDPS